MTVTARNPIVGAMQSWPLTTPKLIDHAAVVYPTCEIVSRQVDGHLLRTSWGEVACRAKRLAKALLRLGVRPGDRVGTIAWNTHRHIESWYAIAGVGAVVHTINPRLFREQIVYIVNHAKDTVLLFDSSFAALIGDLAPDLPTVKHFILFDDHLPYAADGTDFLSYETLIEPEDDDIAWTTVDENAPAALCYTSGTTGNPKGVLYSHRSTVLHSWTACLDDALGLSSRSVVLPVVPMFHANAWSIPYSAAMVGAKLVLAGPSADPVVLHELIMDEGVNLTAAVPTVWLGVLKYLSETGQDLGPLKRVVIGGSAAPRSMIDAFEREYGVTVSHLWGLTETSPIGTVGMPRAEAIDWPYEQQLDAKCKQGRPPFGVEMTITDDTGAKLPHDGTSAGNLKVRGPWVVERYFGAEKGVAIDEAGWFDTGDIATIDAFGYMQVTDRAKDVIKSGGEWISSIEIENATLGCAGVEEAAVIGIPHPRWGERPLLFVVKSAGSSLTPDAILDHLGSQIAKWWLPDEIRFIDCIPHTATGKISKKDLRARVMAPTSVQTAAALQRGTPMGVPR